MAFECKNCERKQRNFTCASCINTFHRKQRAQLDQTIAERDAQVVNATRALHSIEPARIRKAALSQLQTHVDDLLDTLVQMRKDNERKRDRLRAIRESIALRRRNLTSVKLSTSQESNIREPNSLSSSLIYARSGLVHELVEVFSVEEIPGSDGQWMIGSLVLPVPGDIPRYPPEHINASITNIIHFLFLLTFYLDIKLPFAMSWSSSKLGLGIPWISGSANGKWYNREPLHLSEDVRSKSESSFRTGFTMLLYDICYLAFTQNVRIPLNEAGEALRNLWRICSCPDLGKVSHEGYPPVRVEFPLEFSHLLQATMIRPPVRKEAHIIEEEWDIVAIPDGLS